jgi:hypothetical protein
VRRVWLQVALAALAGLTALVVCFGALVTFFLLLLASTSPGIWSSSSMIFWVALVILMIVATASLSLPARALGATKDHVTNTAVLSGLGFCGFGLFAFVSFANRSAFALALLALVATPVIGSLVAIHQEVGLTVRLGQATMIAAAAIYFASLLAFLVVIGKDSLLYLLAPVSVASSSWLVVPGIVVSLRSG